MDIREARYVYKLLPLVSIDLDVYLLVLACGSSSIGEDLSRGQLPGLAPRGCNCACWRIFLSKGIGSSVGPFPSVLTLLIKVFNLKRCAGFSVRGQTSYSSRKSERDSGGHFAAYEKPEVLVDDLRKMFRKGGPAAGVVLGHTVINGF
jgi:hypothetical protein